MLTDAKQIHLQDAIPGAARRIETPVVPRAASMRLAVLAGPGEVRVEERPLPEPGPGEVRIQLEGCGVCGSNLPVWEGRPWFEYPYAPGAPGHEGWGHIDAVGDGVMDLQPGDRVAALSYHAFATHDIATADAVVKLPDVLDKSPFPGEPLGCAINVFRRSDIRADQTVAIIGVGFLGALLTRLAAHAGARVMAITRRSSALEMARRLGADETIPMDDHTQIIEQVRALTDGVFCDRVIECVGQQWPLDLAAELTRERGRLVVAGYHQDGPRQVNMQLWNWRGLDVINAHERDTAVYVQGIREAIDAVVDGRLDPSPLYTHAFTLDELSDALHLLKERPEGFMKAMILMRERERGGDSLPLQNPPTL